MSVPVCGADPPEFGAQAPPGRGYASDMCVSRYEPNGPRRCSGDTRGDLERSEEEVHQLAREREVLTSHLEALAADEEWDRVLSAVLIVQEALPAASWIGGAAVAAHTGSRRSHDADHVIPDLDKKWPQIKSVLESLPRWQTTYPKIPVNMMGRVEGVPVSVRKLNRTRPIEEIEVTYGDSVIKVATLAELGRLKAMAAINRNATKDYLDVVALDAEIRRQGHPEGIAQSLRTLDDYYTADQSMTRLIAERLANPVPRGSDPQGEIDRLRGVAPALQQWDDIVVDCQDIARRL